MTQRARIKKLFLESPTGKVYLPEILDLRISQYGRCIGELKKFEKMDIINKVWWVNGIKHSSFTWHKDSVPPPPAYVPPIPVIDYTQPQARMAFV